jgi:hypothetical protein
MMLTLMSSIAKQYKRLGQSLVKQEHLCQLNWCDMCLVPHACALSEEDIHNCSLQV